MRKLTMNNIIFNKDNTFLNEMVESIRLNENISSWELFKLNYHVKRATLTPQFSNIQSLCYLPHMTFLKHQLETAKTVIEKMNGRAILADEVGLGKTIEAGLILKEYMIRGLVQNALILVPAPLVTQWVKELNDKFHIPVASYRKNYAWDEYPFYVASLDLAKRDPHKQQLLQLNFDMVIIDEAHKLKNEKTQNHLFAKNLKKKYCLLLTATPIQNKVMELFHLVSILKPGYLGNYEQFTKTYNKNKMDTLQDSHLNKLIQKVMVRNRRKDTILKHIKRNVHNITLEFNAEEQKVYDNLAHHLQTSQPLAKITFLKQLCSSREACYLSLQKNSPLTKDVEKSILRDIEQLPHHTKAKKLVTLIRELKHEKVIVFTEYRATQFYLQWYLNEAGITSVAFHGGLRRGQKQWVTELFKRDVQVFIATEAGGEGMNLQFCNYIINYDLPWNPMRIEQRIGRIHRYGQAKDVHIYNFSIKHTLEDHLLHLLYTKLNVFERVIGQLDQILEKLHIHNIETEIKQLIGQSKSTGEAKVKVNNFISIVKNMDEENSDSYDQTN